MECTTNSEIKYLYNRADFKKHNSIVVRECTVTGDYISVSCLQKKMIMKIFRYQIHKTQFYKKEFVNKMENR